MFLRRLLTYIFILFACLASYGQVNQVLWGKGKALYANPIATIDSLTYGQLLYGDTLYIIFDRQSKRIVYDTIHIHMPGIVFHDTIYTTDTIYLESGRRIGLFSVGPNQYVTFSQGNLQYTQSTDTWQFANEQWECIGAGNIKEGALADKIDLFGWSANNTTAPWGVSLSRNNADYAGEFVDWGKNIINSDVPNTWRTLTNEEWEYVLNGRDNASQLRCRAQVNKMNGFVFLPDEWICPDGIELNLEQQTTKVFTRDEWSKMENAGAVFLPAAGRIDNKKLVNFDDHGNYWSSTRINDQWVDYLAFTFSSNKLYVDHQMPIYLGRSVRLVRDTIVPIPEYVDLGLSVKWATFNLGATSPEDYGDYFAWGETEPKEEYSWETYKWSTSSKLTKYNATDGKTVLDLDDDAAYVHWGGKWRMPSKEEVDELTQQCTWIWTTHNNVNGYKVTGPNGNSIFLPAVGYQGAGPSYPAGEDGLYWTKNKEEGYSYAYGLCIHDDAPPKQASARCTRYFGFAVRAVYDDRPPKRIGVFSVAADKQVSFSQGNLQYTQNTDEWRFAREQYEYIGAANIKDGALADKIDLFGWSGKDSKVPFGVGVSSNYTDYQGEFVDWGTNTISGDAPDTWRTLSIEEWEYIYHGRENADQLLALATLEGVQGLVLLPDNWQQPEDIPFVSSVEQGLAWDATRVEGSYFDASNKDHTQDNIYTHAQWQVMEALGAVFVPCAGWRQGNTWLFAYNSEIKSKYLGSYWSCTIPQTSGDYYFFRFTQQEIRKYSFNSSANPSSLLARGRSVRLVHDTIVPETIPNPCLVVKVNDTLSINMMCVEGGTFMMGAMEGDTQANANEKPAHEVTLTYDYYIGQTEVTQALWKAVMGYNPSTIIGDNLPVNNVLWGEAQAFVYKLNQITGLSFDLPTEAEWEYAARGGKKSKGYLYAGSNKVDEVAWYNSNSGGVTHPVAQKMPNELGIYDMSGNVWEWCSDWLAPYSAEALENPIGPATGAYHVYHGGGWDYGADYCRISHRRITLEGYVKTGLGLRIALREKVEPEAVDMGLSVKWATYNVGASNPEDYGDYFAWGETEPKETYSWATYKWCDGTQNTMTKYNATDGKIILDSEDDAAHVHWGGKWRMPSDEEFTELREKCTWTWVEQNGINGYIVKGPNDNTIFMPIGGYMNGTSLTNADLRGYYWSSSIDLIHNRFDRTCIVSLDSSKVSNVYSYRRFGLPIRPVYDDRPPKRIGVFSVAAGKQVSFSQGNLQYTQSTEEWRFAREQYEYIGAENIKDGKLADRIDLFGWSADNTTAPFGVSTSTNVADYAGTFVDWGTNEICGDAPGIWRTLSADEWEYLFEKRPNALQLRSKGSIDGHRGHILLPDDWVLPEGVQFVAEPNNLTMALDINSYTQAEWSIMEEAGAIFLPAAGRRDGTTVGYLVEYSGVWSSSSTTNTNAFHTYYNYESQIIAHHWTSATSRINGRSVRLVHDTIVPETIPDPCLVVKVNDTLSINMMCVEGGTFTMGDGDNAHPVSLSSYSIGQTEVTQALWEAVMGTNPSANTTNKQLPVTNISWYDCQEFIKKLNQLTGMRFRLPTEAEWEYAARGGQKSKGYTYAGSNDLKEVAWYNGNSGNRLHAVAQKKPNELGIYDMSGNAWEWCHDWHAPYPTTHQYNPLGPEVGQVVGKRYIRVFRGGSYGYAAAYHQNTFRDITGPEPDKFSGNLGLRLVLSDDVNFQTIHVNDTLSFHMMDVKGGTFMMGAMEGDKQAHANEKPAHQVTLTYDYYIGQTEVTQALWQAVMGNNPSTMIGDNLPVNNVLWEDADAFAKRLSQLTGCSFHLPTEAEWEFAARGGNKSQGYLYAGSNNIQEVAWYGSNSGNTTQPVGTKQPNELGIYDMSGNVIEWCSDWLGPYSAEPQVNPIGPATGAYHVYCGGCWYLPADVCRCTHRRQTTAGYGEAAVGLRVALREKVEPEYVDLGLSVKWATFNVGASRPEDYGDYFAWGETEPKDEYKWENYKWCNATAEDVFLQGTNREISEDKLTKYNAADGLITLLPEDDAATANWGNKWRMPTRAECQELIDNCTWEKTTLNGVSGYQITGSNNNSIFLPEAGYKYYENFPKNCGSYWPANGKGRMAHTLHWWNPNKLGIVDGRKYCGVPIRPVYNEIPDPCLVVKVNDTLSINMMCVEGGTFMMGEGRTDAHQVTLSDYYIGETEVTCGLWKAVMDSIPLHQSKYPDNYPVAHITLADCRAFVERLSELTGRHFRLPTEAEWEYAARGGKYSKGFVFAGSDDINEVAYWQGNVNRDENGNIIHRPAPVKERRPNELGIYDMTGNLCEWVSDWHGPYNKYPQINPTGPAVPADPGYPCHYRGGCWTYTEETSQNTYRHGFYNRGANGIGLRLVMSDEEPFRAVYLNDTTRFYLRPVKKGTFMMGSREDDPIIQQNLAAKADELPQHKVTLDSDYWVAEYELTQALWTAVMGTDIYDMQAALTKPGSGPVLAGPSYPMYFVYTKDVLEFTRRLSQMTGLNFRLPTEAEWEFAARGGNLTHGYLYAGSNNVDSVAWYTGSNSGIQIVGQKMPNELGIYDLSGNVLERCIDYLEYHQPYDPKDSINPRGRLLQSGNRAYRGGAHNMHKDSVRVTHRAPQTPTYTSQNVGTRLVVNEEHHFQTFNVGSVWFDMIFVKGGTFQMGATEEQGSEAAANEFPVHEVTLSDYYIGQIEVTQRLWQTVMGSSNNPSTIKDSNKPVNNVTWEECQVFVEKLSKMTGYYFRLPTEAEWEFAARGGNKSKGYKYAGSDNLSDVAWYTNNSGGTTHTFATKQPNELGIYDMSGNVWEWCYDWCGPYSAEAQVDPTGPETGEYHMYRGGGWKYFANTTRVAYRRRTYQGYDPTSLGLRLAMSKNAMIPLPEPDPIPGRRIGVFSVAKDKQVSFSQGNLQYTQSKNQWRFAENQYDYLGDENVKDGQLANRIDLFGWSGKYSNAPWGISNSTNTADYAGDFVDWGANVIGGDVANTWRTLSKEEWDYIVKGRRNAEQLHSKCCINNVKGLLLLPDNWVSIEGISIEKVADADTLPSDVNVFTLEQWKQMEAAGAVFLPAAGANIQPTIKHTNRFGGYCSSTKKDVNNSYILAFHVGPTSYTEYSNNKYGRSVRLVRDTIVPKPEYVDLGLSVKWATFNVGASRPEDYGDYFAWGETEPKETYSWTNYKWCDGTQNTMTKYNATDGKTILDSEDDAAHVHWGGKWRMPTKEEMQELFDNCTWKEETRNAINGYIVTGPNGNSIFIPTAGFYQFERFGTELYKPGYSLYYRTNTLNPSFQSSYSYGHAYDLSINDVDNRPDGIMCTTRRNGFPIRPVYDEIPEPCLVVKVNDTLSINMMCVEGGTFMMGDDNISIASPAHQVTLSDYYIGQTEVTQTLWKAVMGNIPTGNKNPSYPVGYVSYADCQDFISKLNNLTGLHFQLPTEAEWEYAAMGGHKSHNYIYSGSNTIDDVAWYDQNSENKMHHVGAKQPNELGIYDMSGNAWEWCADYYDKYTAENQINPQGPATGTDRVLRSGSFRTTADRCTNKHRQARDADYPDSHISFRLVLHNTVPVLPEPEYVDLGLSVKWATFNLGATSPEDYGDYFAWGETEPKETYSWANYKWCDGTVSKMTKYNATDGKAILEPDDDAAQVNWGGNWRMPTVEEQTELREQCTWTWTSINGITGYVVTGPNGKSIFLPAAGNITNTDLSYAGAMGYQWSSSVKPGISAHRMHFSKNTIEDYNGGSRACGASIRPVYDDRPPKRIGVFSVGAGKKVSFSQGNLQYIQSTKTWQFARNQYDYLGEGNLNGSQLANRIDLFGWSANNSTAPFGISNSSNNADYAGDFVDWGVNTIQGDAPNTWRTLSADEWEYLFENRANATQLYGVAQVAGINGMIILPDDWVAPDGITFQPGCHKSDLAFAQHQTFTEQQWLLMETAGAIFLPAAGIVYNSIITAPKAGAHYQSSDKGSDNTNYWFGFRSSYYTIQNSETCTRRSVRLVHDTILPPPVPEYVDLGLSVKWATFNLGATSPEDYGDYFAWGETEPKDEYTWENYKWCDGTDTHITKYNTSDGKITLELEDDAAHVNWGSNWRMPRKDELKELIDSCQWERVTLNDVVGNKITGPNGNSIFIPAAGSYNSFDDQLNSAGTGGWLYSSTKASNTYANEVNMGVGKATQTTCSKCLGLTIRPVYDD